MTERILNRLTPNGLGDVIWDVSDTTFDNDTPEFIEADISFRTTRRREKLADFLTTQINKLACQHCPLATEEHTVSCTKARVADSLFFRVGAGLSSQNPLTRREWEVLLDNESILCQPEDFLVARERWLSTAGFVEE